MKKSLLLRTTRLIDNFNFVFQLNRKPILPYKIFKSYIKYFCGKNLADKPLRNIDVALDYACNLKCEHCSCEMLKNKTPSLDEAELSSLAAQAQEMGAFYFSFTGGEPLLQKNLEDVFQLFNPFANLIGLQTNAILLDKIIAKKLYKAGLDVIQVSLDSGDPDIHDSFRHRKGAYRDTLNNVASAREIGIRVIFSATLTHSQIRSEATLRLLRLCETLHAPIVISVPCPVGRWSNDFSETLDDLDREHLLNLHTQFPQLRRDFHSNYSRMGCSAATEKLYVTPYGDVIPCPFIHISFGNIRNESLRAIRSRMLRVDEFRRYNQVCLAGEDAAFIDGFIKPVYQAPQLPMPWSDNSGTRDVCRDPGGERS